MSKPFYQDLFAFHGRRNRKSFLIHCTIVWLVSLVIGLAAYFVFALEFEFELKLVFAFTVILLGQGPLLVSGFLACAQRFRDIGWTGWATLILAIPFLGIIIGLVIFWLPGTVGENRYGPDPLQ